MKTILILGGHGFIGSNVLNYIDNYLSDFYNVILFNKSENHPYGVKFNCNYKSYHGDFSDVASLKSIFIENKIDIVFHFISTTTPATSSNILYDIKSNLIATIEFVNLMVAFNVKDIVYLSSGGSVYGKNSKKNSETSLTQAKSSYGIVKLAIEKYLMMFADRGQIRPLILRLSNPYGPYHYSMEQGVINIALRAALKKNNFSVWGNGENSKDYIYIEDFVEILFKLIDSNINNQILNVGSGNLVSINNILSHITNIYPKFSWNFIKAKNHDILHFELELTKLKSLIGNHSFTSIEDGIIKTNKWLKNHINSDM